MPKNTSSRAFVKTDEEIEIMKTSGKICAEALKVVLANVKVGVTCQKLDEVAKQEILKRKASPSFTTVDNYQHTICTTVNEQVVHGIPGSRTLKDGDIIGIDIGAFYSGYHSDQAITVPVGHVSEKTKTFLKTGKTALNLAMSYAKPNNYIGDISSAIERTIKSQGYAIVKSLTGHGIGRELHEEPYVPGFGRPKTGPRILENMVLAIEVIYTEGSGEVGVESDNWTITSADSTLGGLFEKTVAIGKNGPIVLTPYL